MVYKKAAVISSYNTGTSVLSIQTSDLGHSTYANLMRQYFAGSECRMDSVWLNDNKELLTRIVWHLVTRTLPIPWMQRHNFDLRRFRHEIGTGYIGRRAAERNLHKNQYQVLHFHTQVPALLSIELMRRIPTVITGDATATLIAGQDGIFGQRWTHGPSILADRRVFQAATKIAMWSEWAAKSVINEYGINPHKVSVVYPGVDLDRLPPVLQRVVSRDPVRLLFVGGDFERKGGHDLLNVYLQHFTESAELHLMTNADIFCNHPRVVQHCNVKAYSPKWMDLYNAADVFVLPTHSEAFGLVFTEAMAMGLPVIGTNINAIPEIVSHGKTGFLVPPGDLQELTISLTLLINNVALRQKMGRAGAVVAAEKFNARTNLQRLETLFQEVARNA